MMARSIGTSGRSFVSDGRGLGSPFAGTIIDDFSDGNINEYTSETGQYSVVSAPNNPPDLSFDNVLKNDGPNNSSFIYSFSGLNSYFADGEVGYFHIYNDGSSSGSSVRVIYGAEDANNWWTSVVSFDNSTVLAKKKLDGTFGYQDEGSLSSAPTETWLELKIERRDGTSGGTDNDLVTTVRDMENDTVLGSVTKNDNDHQAHDGIGVSIGGRDSVVYWSKFYKE